MPFAHPNTPMFLPIQLARGELRILSLVFAVAAFLPVIALSESDAWADSKERNAPSSGPRQISNVRVGSTSISIPIPPEHIGGEKVPAHLRPGAPQNDVLAVFIRYADYLTASKGMPTIFKTVYRVEILRRAIGATILRPELEVFKNDIRNGFVEKHLPDITANINKQYSEQKTNELSRIIGTKIDQIAIGQPMMLGIVDESDDWVSIAMLAKVRFDVQGV